MTHPSFPHPSNFEKLKRQSFLFESYYENYQRFFTGRLLPVHQQNLIENRDNPAWMADVCRTYAFDLFNFWQLRYTSGENIALLDREFGQVVELYEKKARFEREAKADPAYPAFDLAYLDDYVRYVALLSIAILLHRVDLIPRLHDLIAGSEFDKDDALIEELLTRYLPERPYLDTFYHDEPYEPLLDATAGDTPDEKLADLKAYLKKWYGGMKGTGWYNAHKGMTDEGGGGYDGYWAWEAGAIAYLHGIDDTTINSMYYPKDLVAYARSIAPPPSDMPLATPAQRLRCEAGQPCPRSGSWTSPAFGGGRRAFRQGEVMPEIEGNAWGATIWYFDETKQ